jgi:hypothetical protein
MFCLLIASGYLLLGEVRPGGSADVVVETEEYTVSFSRVAPLSDTFMTMGGDNDPLKNIKNFPSHISLHGLPMRDARSIHRRYPEFRSCKSPGADEASKLTKWMSLIGADDGVKDALIDFVDRYEKRGRDHKQTCVKITGVELNLESIRLKEDGTDATSWIARFWRNMTFYIAEKIEIRDCQPLLY